MVLTRQQQIAECKLQRETLTASIEAAVEEMETAITEGDKPTVRQLLAQLDDEWQQIETNHTVWYAELVTELEKTAELKYRSDTRKAAIRLRIRAQDCLAVGVEQAQAQPQVAANSFVDIPKLELKKFKGKEPQEWGPWWNHFRTSIHENPRLKAVQKFNYLVQCCQEAAADTIGGFSVEEEFYDDAIQKLKNRFGRTASIQSSHYAALARLPAITDRGDLAALRKFYDDVTCRVRSLRSSGVEEASYKDILKPILLVKIPSGMSVDWHREKNHDTKDLTALLNFIEEELISREDSEMLRREHRNAPSQKQKAENQNQNKSQGQTTQNQPQVKQQGTATSLHQGSAATFYQGTAQPTRGGRGRARGRGRGGFNSQSRFQQHSNAEPYTGGMHQQAPTHFNQTIKYPCVFCKAKGHFAVQCTMPVGERWQLVTREKRCHVCLRDNHQKSECTAERACRECPEPHHTSLHFNRDQAATSSATYTRTDNRRFDGGHGPSGSQTFTRTHESSRANNSTAPIHSALSASTGSEEEELGPVIPMTGTVLIDTPKGPQEALLIMDGGADKSFLREEFGNKNRMPTIGSEYLAVQPFGSPTPNRPKLRHRRKITIYSRMPGAQKFTLFTSDEEELSPAKPYIKTRFAQQLTDSGHWLADDRFFENNQQSRPYDLLIGGDYYWRIVGNQNISNFDGLQAIPSLFGYFINGPTKDFLGERTSVHHAMLCQSMSLPSLDQPDWQREISSDPAELSAEALEANIVTMLSAISHKDGWDASVDFDLQSFWNLEGQGVNDKCEGVGNSDPLANYSDSIHRHQDGSFSAPLPWMGNKLKLQKHFELCTGRLNSLLIRLRRDPDLMVSYHQQIMDNVERGYVQVADPKYNGICTYLPHHPVVKPERTTTKVRPVFDGSAKTKSSPSLNQCLYTGPNNTPDLLAVLLRFRIPKVVWMADIEKAFHQVLLAQEDSEVVRFLWVKDPFDPNSPIIHYVWKCLPFGLVCSPFILRAVIDKLLEFYSNVYPQTVQVIRDQLYVDDGLGGAETTKIAQSTIDEIKIIFSSANMKMRKWLSNDPTIQAKYGDANSTEQEGVISQALAGNASPKVLGLTWDAKEDNFSFNPEKIINAAVAISGTPTKRQVAQISARIFDPIGFLAPVTVIAKILFQKIWISKIEWDQPVSKEVEADWHEFIQGLKNLSKLKIPRRAVAEAGRAASAELHIFCDASQKAIGAVAYLRTVSTNREVQISMLTGRTRVAPPPPKSLTMPRLELLAAQLGASLLRYITHSLRSITLKPYLWSDSTITLAWIKGTKERKVFVQNRINDIRKCTSPDSWRHCPGEDNPADIASRGASAESIIHSTKWWTGPSWLPLPESNWPVSYATPTEDALSAAEVEAETKPAPRKVQVHLNQSAVSKGPPLKAPVSELTLEFFPRRFSTLDKFLRVTAYVFRFIRRSKIGRKHKILSFPATEVAIYNNGRPFRFVRISALTVQELEAAHDFWIGQMQRDAFPQEYYKMSQNQPLRHSNLAEQRPSLDPSKQLIRLAGRIQPIMNGGDQRPPILLPDSVVKAGTKGTVSGRKAIIDLIVRAAHKRVMHAGLRATLAELRERYWIVRGRQVVKSVLRTCVVCQRFHSKHFEAPAAPLPAERTTESRPFEITGVDFAGPLFIRHRYTAEGERAYMKAYICLFTCATARAIHLELVEDLTTHQFILAIRRFFAIRGTASIIYSDNAKTFKLSAKYFKKLERDGYLHEFLQGRRLQWRFSASLAPWWGAYWERLVRNTKEHLRKTKKASLSFSETETILAEVSFVINSRPLTYVTDGSDGEPFPLTPFALISGYKPTSQGEFPPPTVDRYTSTRDALVNREKRRRRALEDFWYRWRKDYIADRGRFTAPGRVGRTPKLNQAVLIHDANSKRIEWPTAIIKELIKGRDDVIRMAILRTHTGATLDRPVQRLYPLELEEDEERSVENRHPFIRLILWRILQFQPQGRRNFLALSI